MNPRKIAVVTGTRADYGLLRWLMAEITERPGLKLQIIATGMHLAVEFGETWHAIVDDGFTIDERVEMLLGSDSASGIVKSTGLGTIGMADALTHLSPDIVVLLGDRFEVLAAAQAAMLMNFPIAHIAGGEVTEGAFDDSIRHAITKMSHLHFTAADEYRARVIQLGENPQYVFQVGAVGLDNLVKTPALSAADLSEDLDFDLTKGKVVVCTFHPETLAGDDPASALAPLFSVLDELVELRVIITKGNADPGGRDMNRQIDTFVAEHRDRMAAFTSLGQSRYLSLLSIADAVIGNSSSGIVEAPSVGTPTVNIGNRQKGRLRAPSIIDVENTAAAIRVGVERALTEEFRGISATKTSPYGAPGAATKIADVLERIDLDAITTKTFHTL
jgi:UDP-hydrolysing UDP-N-acetyl-D-glucosamine 2-epimerase